MRRLRKIVGIAAAAVLCVGSAGRAIGAGQEPITIGALFPLTGGIAVGGHTSANGTQLAVDDINAHGGIKSLGGAKLKLVVRDSTSDASGSADAASRLIDEAHPIAIVGAYASGLSVTASSVAERRAVPFCTMSYSDELTTRGFKNIFQVVSKASAIGMKTLDYTDGIAKRAGQNVKSIAIVYENTPYGTSQADALKKQAERDHVNVALYEEYSQGLTDAAPLVQKIASSNAQVLFPMSLYTDAVLLIRGLAQRNVHVQIVGGSGGFVIPAFYDTARALTEGVMSMNTSNYDAYGNFEKAYYAKFHTFAPHEAYENAVCVYAIRAALEKSKATTPEALRTALAGLNVKGGDFAGIPGGGIKFDPAGLNELATPIMVQWHHSNLVTVWPPASAKAKASWDGKTIK